VTEQHLPDPLVPAEVDLRDFATMPLAVQLLRDSRFAAEVSAEAFRAGVLLWCAAWHQVPAGSLPDNDAELAKLAGYGFVVKEWKKVKAQALTQFVRCSDGRLYHETVSERAMAAWRSRLEHYFGRAKERLRKVNKARADAKPPLPPLPDLTFDQWNERRLASGVPVEKAEAFDGVPPTSAGTNAGIPPENALKGEGTEREREQRGINTHVGAGTADARVPPETVVEPDPPDPPNAKPTAAGLVCRAMKAAGIADPNPGHPDLLALIDAGATEAEFAGAARAAVDRGKGFAYAMGMLKRQRAEASKSAQGFHKGPLPNRQEAQEQRNRAVADRWASQGEPTT
jgi:hypothetical protein